jgi:hypothetical protein
MPVIHPFFTVNRIIMRKLFFLPVFLLFSITIMAQSGRVCVPFDSTFHFLKPGNINFWVQGGLLMTAQTRELRLYQSMAFNLHYVPVKYLQTGVNLSKRLPVEDGVSFWKSYELSIFARYSFIRMDCPKMGVYAHAGYTNVVEVQKHDAGKAASWYPYGGIGIYKDLGRSFSVQVENQLYFNNYPSQVSVNLVWKFMNCKF